MNRFKTLYNKIIFKNQKNNIQDVVFLGGTCNGSDWRDKIIPLLNKENIKYFNPIVENWTPECVEKENYQKSIAKIQLFTITPLMIGVYSIAELVQSSNDNPIGTIFCLLKKDKENIFTERQLKSLYAVKDLIIENGSCFCESLEQTVQKIKQLING